MSRTGRQSPDEQDLVCERLFPKGCQRSLVDLIAVVDEATARAQRLRPERIGRASRESCVAALRSGESWLAHEDHSRAPLLRER